MSKQDRKPQDYYLEVTQQIIEALEAGRLPGAGPGIPTRRWGRACRRMRSQVHAIAALTY